MLLPEKTRFQSRIEATSRTEVHGKRGTITGMNRSVRVVTIGLVALVLLVGCITVEFVPFGSSSPDRSSSSVRSSSQPLSSLRVGNNQTLRLEPALYEGTLSINANNATLVGTGIGRTVIRGRITINGNSNEIRGVTIIGTVTINGNNNNLSRCDLSDASVFANGNNNHY